MIDDLSDSGTMVLAVTGKLILNAISPGTLYTRLISNANPADTSINVATATDWAVGDEITLGPTEYDGSENEKVNITSLTVNNDSTVSVGVDPPIQFFHYGDS